MSGNSASTWVGVAGFEPAASSSRTKDGQQAGGTGDAVTSGSMSQDTTSHPTEIPAPDAPVTHAGDFSAGLAELAELIQWHVGVWHDLGYAEPLPSPDCHPIPPLGRRSAEAIEGGHAAIEDIDGMMRQLYKLREQLVSELRQDSDIRAVRVDAMLAERKAARLWHSSRNARSTSPARARPGAPTGTITPNGPTTTVTTAPRTATSR